jgi:hypothetical protein
MKTIWSRGNGGDYFYYYCICNKQYVRADTFDNRIVSMVRDYSKSIFTNKENFGYKIIPGKIESIKLIELSRRLNSSRPKFRRNILRNIINAVYLTDGKITIELR